MVNRKELKEKLPHGYSKKVAERAGVSEHAVSRYLNNKLNSEVIEMAVLEVLAELSDKKKALLAKINS